MNQWQREGQAETALALVGLVGLMLVGCGGGVRPGSSANAAGIAGTSAPLSPSDQKVVKFSSRPLHRFQGGDTWNYVIRQGKKIQKCTITVLADKVKSPAGKECSVFQVSSIAPSGKAQNGYGAFSQDKDGSEFLYGTSATDPKTFNWGIAPHDHSIRVQSPMFQGEHWRNTMRRQDGSELDYEAVVRKQTNVDVPAGHFNAMEIHEASDIHNPGQKVSHREDDLWFDPAIGFPVRQVTIYSSGLVIQDLVSYKLAGVSSSSEGKNHPAKK